MKVNVVAVGKIKEKYFTDAINEYKKRISRFAEFKIIECAEYPVKNQSPAEVCLLYTSPSPRDRQKSRMPSSA